MRSRRAVLTWLPFAFLAALAIAGGGAAPVVEAVNVRDTRLVCNPATGLGHVAFIYADDLWVADLDGKNVRRLTTDAGVAGSPVISPDGKTIAFTARYQGNPDVYVVPVEGGVPTRLTAHPGPDLVRGFTPDGKAVLFSSPRSVFTDRFMQLFTVPIEGGFPTQLPIPHGFAASYSPDGGRIAYTPLRDASAQWKNYRGGTISRIWIFRFEDNSVVEIPQPQGGCNDLDPRWLANKVYFRSDRDGEFNVYAYDVDKKQVNRLTNHKDHPVANLGAGGGQLIYEQAGYLHLLDPESARSRKLALGVAADLRETMPRYVKGAKYVRNAAISPSGSRAVFEFRGEIVTVPAEKGDPRNLSNTPGAHERSPAWSPDGQQVAYFSDEGGEYRLIVRDQLGKDEPKAYRLEGAGFYFTPTWSPDGKKLAYTDNSMSLYWIDLGSGLCTKVASEPYYGPFRSMKHGWSPDSQWLAYAVGNKAAIQTIYVYSLADRKSHRVTDGLSEVTDPVFDASGKYLYFLGSTDAGPVKQWFAQSNSDMRATYSIYLAVLRKDLPSPFTKESDEEKGSQAKSEKSADEKPLSLLQDKSGPAQEAAAKRKETQEGDAKKPTEAKEPFRIDFEGLDQRILALPLPAGDYADLQAGAAGQVYYLRRAAGGALDDEGKPATGQVFRFDVAKRKAEKLAAASSFRVTPDGKKLLTFTPPETWMIVDATPTPPPGKGRLNLDAVQVRIDPRAEWAQIFDEAWRINRDYFYATNYHGADWPAMKTKYAPFLADVSCRSDLNRVIRWMCSELGVGHSYLFGGESLSEPKPIPVGLLGADYEVANGRYRFKKVYGGLNWSPGLRSPLTAPGVNVRAGEYLLAVRGKEIKPPEEIHARFEDAAGKAVEITVGPNPDGAGSRTVTVEPVADEYGLRNRDWVEGNLRKVEQATGGRVAYVYVPNTAAQGHEYFKRYFFPQAHKEAIIIDERFNGGGQVADYYIDHLRRPFTANWATRYGEDIVTPGAAVFGPKVMIIEENAGSGGDLLPWMFRKYGLGKLVGKRTWGGLVGILGFPVLMDGAVVTAPNLAIWTENGWVVENVGVPPDVEVEQWPADVIAGKDPQLEAAIQLVMDELTKNPPKKMERPPFPVRVGDGPKTPTGQ